MKVLFTTLFFVLSLAWSCSPTKNSISHPTVTIALPNDEAGTIIIRSSGEGRTEAEAVQNAEIKAFTTIFYQGFPSSVQKRPLIGNRKEAEGNSRFFEDFFKGGGYKTFIMQSFNYSLSRTRNKDIFLNRDIKIDLNSLRAHLENQGIIKKFGF
jgi:hypothetical protein